VIPQCDRARGGAHALARIRLHFSRRDPSWARRRSGAVSRGLRGPGRAGESPENRR